MEILSYITSPRHMNLNSLADEKCVAYGFMWLLEMELSFSKDHHSSVRSLLVGR